MTCGLHAGVLQCVTTRLAHRSVRGAGSSRSLSEVQQTYCERTARRDRHWTAVQRFRAALNFLHAISRYHDADSSFLENFSLIRVRKFPVRQGHRFKDTPDVTKPSWKLRLGGGPTARCWPPRPLGASVENSTRGGYAPEPISARQSRPPLPERSGGAMPASLERSPH